jgi:hypothetical protein
LKVNVVANLACFQSVPYRPFLAPTYWWPGLKEWEGLVHITTSVYDMNLYFD